MIRTRRFDKQINRGNMKRKLVALLLALGLLCPLFSAPAVSAKSYTVAEVESLCDGIVGYKDPAGAQHFIDHELSGNAGINAEFYIIALRQKKRYDFSSYEKAMIGYINSHEIYSATSKEKYALALIAAGSHSDFIQKAADEAIGDQGLMSLVFGLHLLNNGYHSRLYSTSGLINEILAKQLDDGGWAVIGSIGDVDVTAMTVQALTPYYRSDAVVKKAIDRAIALLSRSQLDSGGFKTMGKENCESAAQVLTTLSGLGINQNTDSRFIKNGNTVLDVMLKYRNADGSFTHTGGGANETATMQAFYALTAYSRYCQGKGPLYVIDKDQAQPAQQPTQKPQDKKIHSNGGSERSGAQSDGAYRSEDAPQSENGGDNNHDQPQDSDSYQSADQPRQNIGYNSGQPQIRTSEKGTEKSTEKVKPTEGRTQATQAPAQAATERDAGKGAGLFQPTGTATENEVAEDMQPAQKGGYKLWAILGIVAAAGIAAAVLFLLKKRNKKHFIAVGIIAAAGIAFVLLTNFESTEEFRSVEEKENAVGTVTISIRCDTLKGEDLPDYVPDDYIILDDTTFAVADGDTVYDILMEAAKRCNIQVDNRGAAGNAYIAGIGYLYEFDYGDLSGWMYRVDGEFPDVGCQSYALKGGETIEWLYTKDIGKDLSN